MTIVKVRLEGDSEQDVQLVAKQLGVRVSCVKARDNCYQLYGSYDSLQTDSYKPSTPSSLMVKGLEAIESAYQRGHQTLTDLGVGLEGMDIASRLLSLPPLSKTTIQSPKGFDFSADSTGDILADLRSRVAAGRDDDETKALRAELARRAARGTK